MSVRNLDVLFHPRSVALIGASKAPRSVGAVLARNLFGAGFDGPIMPVNPHEAAIEGVLAYPSIEALPLVPDLAVVATPAATVPEAVGALGARGTRAVVVISAGFAELGDQGCALQQAMLDAAKPTRSAWSGRTASASWCPGTDSTPASPSVRRLPAISPS
jgi:acetyltransferase